MERGGGTNSAIFMFVSILHGGQFLKERMAQILTFKSRPYLAEEISQSSIIWRIQRLDGKQCRSR